MGSYICSCPDGYELSTLTNTCEDVNECEVNPGFCEGGTCSDIEGGAFCTCDDGYILNQNTMKCIDVRQEQCYDIFYNGQCSRPRGMSITQQECCCSRGAAWGISCQECPREGSGNVMHILSETHSNNFNHFSGV